MVARLSRGVSGLCQNRTFWRLARVPFRPSALFFGEGASWQFCENYRVGPSGILAC